MKDTHRVMAPLPFLCPSNVMFIAALDTNRSFNIQFHTFVLRAKSGSKDKVEDRIDE